MTPRDYGVMFLMSCVLAVALACVVEWRQRKWQPVLRPPAGCLGERVARMHEVGGAQGRSLAVWCRVGPFEGPWVVDTAFSGAPLLSLPWLVAQARARSDANCAQVYAQTAPRLAGISNQRQRDALDALVAGSAASRFSAGCSNTLVGIGSAETVTTDILLGPGLELRTASGDFFCGRTCATQFTNDVFNTTTMETASLLTCDYLRQVSPTLILPEAGELHVRARPELVERVRARGFELSAHIFGGAFVATVHVAGHEMRLAVDTGSSLTVSLDSQAAAKISACDTTGTARHMKQHGINNEAVCADVVMADVRIGPNTERMPVMLNNTASTDIVDGYLGLSLLRGYDLAVLPDRLLAARNANSIATEFLDAASQGWCGPKPRCA